MSSSIYFLLVPMDCSLSFSVPFPERCCDGRSVESMLSLKERLKEETKRSKSLASWMSQLSTEMRRKRDGSLFSCSGHQLWSKSICLIQNVIKTSLKQFFFFFFFLKFERFMDAVRLGKWSAASNCPPFSASPKENYQWQGWVIWRFYWVYLHILKA